ncbi:alpha/beta fold hydrolase [Pseudoalteromonas denitrificans]|uniref:Esterase n=1 Tax=Pseudoalteromonas denitrificans DSM 6059 TaxID=1123010 RepID=A0A1I1M4D9_9GAMM|nr:alpha/beta fold hydrolase [Pseudoalteromonas denitrificans]SFC79612.1 esterase [Pseudoalteromonas denitrificans DSM 6059]
MQLHYKQTGQGPHLILIHGLFGSFENLNVIARPLSEFFTVTAIDLRNHGRSMHKTEMTYPDMCQDVVHLMSQLNIIEAIFVGHSMGGKVAMQMALTHPEKVNKLVVLDIAPVAYDARHDDVFKALNAVNNSPTSNRQDADNLMSEFVKEMGVRQFLLKSFVKSEAGFQWRFNLPIIENKYHQILAAPSGHPFEGDTLFIKGGNSQYITSAMRNTFLKLFPNCKAKVIHGTGHWLHAEKPTAVNKSITDFILS